jgi:cardiolipin synthase C
MIRPDFQRPDWQESLTFSLRTLLVLALALALSACATQRFASYSRPSPEAALPAQPDGAFAALESGIRELHGPEVSGFRLLDSNESGLLWRLALIDTAQYSIDVQYYLWYGDAAGRLLAKRLLDAADRGVKVRMLVDDLNTLIGEGNTISLRDKVAAWIDAHPNVEIRLFNPWSSREIASRAGEMVTDLQRLNQRMHNKAMIVDNQAVILGGRNIGENYFGLSTEFNFHDLDVLGLGPVARQTSAIFDSYWNSPWVMPVSALDLPVSEAEQAEARAALLNRLIDTPSLAGFPLAPQSWSKEIAALRREWHRGTSQVFSDRPEPQTIDHVMLEKIHAMLSSAEREVRIVNAYIIPAERGIEALRSLNDRGVTIKILTNSLASHDVPAVNSHYKPLRQAILEAGADLFEIRHDAAIQPLVVDTPPTHAKFMGLHAKGMVVDGERVYIGSMNYDPRSAEINTEMGVFIDSPGLAEALTAVIERDMRPVNSWQVKLDDQGKLFWVNDQQRVTRQPARSWWQRVQDFIFMFFPKELY